MALIRRQPVLFAILVVLALSLGALLLFRQHEHSEERAAATARDNVLKAAIASDGKYDQQGYRARLRFDAAIARASKAGDRRHDNGLSENQSATFQAAQAHIELSEVEKAEVATAAQMAAIDRSLRVYEKLYGADAVRNARTEAANFREARELQLNEWGTAIRAIVDAAKLDEQPDSIAMQSIADHYSKSEQSKIHADKFESALTNEQIRLIDRVTDERRKLLKLR